MNVQEHVKDHYSKGDLNGKLRQALENAGLQKSSATLVDLAPLDQFHVGGLEASKNLAEMLSPAPGSTLLDIGSGLGGPARFLAATRDCHVSGVDLSPEFVAAAEYLTDFVALKERVSFQCTDALDLPFVDESFDNAWTQHVAMNIGDRARLYREVCRILKLGGKFAVHDVVTKTGEPLSFPVPWAATAQTSFLLSFSQMETCLAEVGFSTVQSEDLTQSAQSFLERQVERQPWDRPIGLHLAMGPEFSRMIANLLENISSGRIQIIQAIFEKRENGQKGNV